MKILVTGAAGFVGKNLVASLKALRDGKDRTRSVIIDEIFEYDLDTDPALLDDYCRDCDFVFHLAGVNRPKDPAQYMAGNFGFSSQLLGTLRAHENRAPVMLSSSTQASLLGRFSGSEYGISKLAGEQLLLDYSAQTGIRTLVYRFPNLFGKWCRPNYNSAVATFCHNIANDKPIAISDPAVELELLYIDDLICELLDALEGHEHRCEYDGTAVLPTPEGRYCYVPTTHHATLGQIVALLERFREQPNTLLMPNIPAGSFEKKLYSTYLSYLPPRKASFPLTMKSDARGSFTELLKTESSGQFSVNISNPGITKGQHWHHSKWELFIVVSGRALIRQRQLGTNEVLNFEVSGEHIQAVHMLPGYTHELINRSETQPLVTLMWANEPFDPAKPDTFYEMVE